MMKLKKPLIFLGLAVALLFTGKQVFAQGRDMDEIRDRAPMIRPDSTDNRPALMTVPIPQFKAGENIVINEDIEGDLYVAGQTVTINSKVGGDLIAAGRTVIVNGQVANDIRAVGGMLRIDGVVEKNVSVAGAQVTFGPESRVYGSVMAGAGELSFLGEIKGKVWAGGGKMNLAGQFANDVQISADELSSSSEASIAGNLTAHLADNQSSEEELISEQQVAGSRQISRQSEDKAKTSKRATWMKRVGKYAAWGFLARFLLKIISGMIVGSLLIYLLPKLSAQVASKAALNPLASLGLGFAYLVLAPIAAILLLVLVVTAPLGFLLILDYLVAWILTPLVAALIIGQTLAKQIEETWLKNPYVQLLVGLILYQFLGLIPFLGWLAKLLMFFIALGVMVDFGLEILKNRSQQAKVKAKKSAQKKK